MAHEAILRRWGKLRDWIAAEREFLAWRTGLEAARRTWQATPKRSKKDSLLRGAALTQAQSWLARRSDDIPEVDREFTVLSRKATRWRSLRRGAVIGTLVFTIVFGLPGLLFFGFIFLGIAGSEPSFWDVSTTALTAQGEQALKPGDTFKECATCPEMVVVPAGSFMMGSPENEVGRDSNEGPQRLVTIARPFAVAKFEITSAEASACLAHRGCENIGGMSPGDAIERILHRYLNVTSDPGPKTYVSWYKAKQYVAWIAKLTGKPYRLLTEAEWEYAARAGKQTRYSWGDEVGTGNASCMGCGHDERATYRSGKFAPNEFGLYDMHGSVSEWVEDCYYDKYDGAPTDGSARTADGSCAFRVVRGGSYEDVPERLRSASRTGFPNDFERGHLGFRVARTLNR